jgi:hypothetical protein
VLGGLHLNQFIKVVEFVGEINKERNNLVSKIQLREIVIEVKFPKKLADPFNRRCFTKQYQRNTTRKPTTVLKNNFVQ